MVEQLEERLTTEPDNLLGWLRLARAKEHLGLQEDAFFAAVKATELSPRPDLLLKPLEIMLSFTEGEVRRNKSIIENSEKLLGKLSQTPSHTAEALFFGGHINILKGAHDSALSQWRQLLGLLPEESDAAASLRQEIRQLENNQK